MTTPAAIEDKIFELLASRQQAATICPSEVARAMVSPGGSWRPLMPQVRQVAQSLADADRLVVTRGGVPVDALSGGGPIRLGARPVAPGAASPAAAVAEQHETDAAHTGRVQLRFFTNVAGR